MCKEQNKDKDQETLLLYTSNENDTYSGNIFRVLSLPHGYVVSFPYQLQYMNQNVTGSIKNPKKPSEIEIKRCKDNFSRLKKDKKKVILLFSNVKCKCQEKKASCCKESCCYADIPLRECEFTDFSWESTSKSFILHLELRDFVQIKGFPNFCPQARTEFVFIENVIVEVRDWHEIIEEVEDYFSNTPVFFKLEKIWKSNKTYEIIINYFTVLLPCITFALTIVYFFVNCSSLSYFDFIIGIVFVIFCLGIKSFYNFKFFKIGKEKSDIDPRFENKNVSQKFFEIEENSQYFITVHTHCNKKHNDHKNEDINYFIHPTQTDPVLSGNIEERIYMNNNYMTMDIPFETNYLDIRSDPSYLIFRIHKSFKHTNQSTEENLLTYEQTLYHLDVPLRVKVVKPWYKVILFALMLSFVKMMLLPFFTEAEKDFKSSKFLEKFWDCCKPTDKSNIWSLTNCYWDDFILTFITLVVILTVAHYVFKSLMPGHMRMHH